MGNRSQGALIMNNCMPGYSYNLGVRSKLIDTRYDILFVNVKTVIKPSQQAGCWTSSNQEVFTGSTELQDSVLSVNGTGQGYC